MPEIQMGSTIAAQHRSLDLEQNLCVFIRSQPHTSLDQEEEVLIKICSGLNGWIILVPFQGKIWLHLVEYLTLLPDPLFTNSGLELWLSTRGEPLSHPRNLAKSRDIFGCHNGCGAEGCSRPLVGMLLRSIYTRSVSSNKELFCPACPPCQGRETLSYR